MIKKAELERVTMMVYVILYNREEKNPTLTQFDSEVLSLLGNDTEIVLLLPKIRECIPKVIREAREYNIFGVLYNELFKRSKFHKPESIIEAMNFISKQIRNAFGIHFQSEEDDPMIETQAETKQKSVDNKQRIVDNDEDTKLKLGYISKEKYIKKTNKRGDIYNKRIDKMKRNVKQIEDK
jgi:hypothetical protein